MNVPHFDQWLGDWAMEPDRFMAIYHALSGLDLHVHLQTGPERAAAAAKEQSRPVTAGQVAIVGLYGVLMKSVPSGEQGTSTVLARRKIRAAAQDPKIAAIMLHIDSPGGTVAGTEALAADIAAARRRKPVYAYIEDLGASAAYWLASQADKVYANGSGLVGSIGTYMVVHDVSGMAAMKGIKVHVIRAGEMKGQGEPGTEINAAVLAEWQGRVNQRNEFFVRGVATGRGMSIEKVRELADGRMHIAAQALAKGLIDGVQAFDETMNQLVATVSKQKGVRMDATMTEAVVATATATENAAASGNPTPPGGGASSPPAAPLAARPATLNELRAACQGADNDFLVSQLEANASVAQAQTAYMAALAAKVRASDSRIQELEKSSTIAAAAAPLRKPGASAVPAAIAPESDTAAGGDAIEAFQEAVAAEMKRTGKSQHAAHKAVCAKQPELREAMVAAHNARNEHLRRRR